MKNKITEFTASADVVKLDIDLICGEIKIAGTNDKIFKVERTRRTHLKVSESEGTIKIRQTKKPYLRKTLIKVSVPAFCLPDIILGLKSGNAEISDGVYGSLRVKAENINLSVYGSSFAEADVSCKTLKMECGDISAKNTFLCAAEQGETIIENCRCKRIDLSCVRGDMGITELKCRDGVFTAEDGSINISLKGREDDYSLNLSSANGTCNRENVDGGTYAVKAHTKNGNIVVDFSDRHMNLDYGVETEESTMLAREA